MGGGSNDAQKQAQQNEQQRQRAIRQGTASVNSVFDAPSRQAQYNQLSKDTTDYYLQKLNQQKQANDRNLKFALARGGQIGGSVQADEGAQAAKDYQQGVLQSERQGQRAGANLRSQDEQERANLTAMVQNGLDATTAAQDASSALRANLQSAQSTARADALGNVFGNFADLYQRSQDAKALRQGQKYGYGTIYGPTGGGYGR